MKAPPPFIGLRETGLHRTVTNWEFLAPLQCCFSLCDLTQKAVNSLMLRVRLLLFLGEERNVLLPTLQTFWGEWVWGSSSSRRTDLTNMHGPMLLKS